MSRVAVVTGGTRGIGGMVASQLKEKGYTVAAVYGGNDETAEKFKNETGIPVYKIDVSDFDACQAGIGQNRTWAQSKSWSTTPALPATAQCIGWITITGRP